METQPFTLVLAGGVFRHPAPLVAKVRTTSPNSNVMQRIFEPVIGSLLIAFENIGPIVDDA